MQAKTEQSLFTKYKKLKSYELPGHAHELTFSCFNRLKLLEADRTRAWFVDALKKARTKHDFAIWAWVIMPEHVHLIVQPRQSEYKMSRIRASIKIPLATRALKYVRRKAPGVLERLKDVQPNGKVAYRFWERGGGYDRNIEEPNTLLTMIEYIHNNPVRRGLVAEATDWIWSSARFYAGGFSVPIEMDALPFLG